MIINLFKNVRIRPFQLNFKAFMSQYPPHTVVPMPALSPTMTKGNIGKFRKKIGDKLSAGDVVVEVETDKAQMEFEYNDDDGYIAIFLKDEGSKDINVGEPLLILATDKNDVPAFSNYKPDIKVNLNNDNINQNNLSNQTNLSNHINQSNISNKITSSNDIDSLRKFSTPIARKVADEKGINISNISGSGPNNRIILADVSNFKHEIKSISTTLPNIQGSKMNPLSNMRRVIAARLSESKSSIPHFYITSEINMDRILKLRQVLNSKNNIKLSINDFIIKASSIALLKVPEVNSAWISENDGIRSHKNADISVAVATPSGLITPIIFEANNLGLQDISSKMKILASKAISNELKPSEYQGGTFAISNLGMNKAVKNFTAIINPPQSAILAVGTTREIIIRGPGDVGSPDAFIPSQVMDVSLSCDHRVIDGAVAAKWLHEFKSLLEDPFNMLL